METLYGFLTVAVTLGALNYFLNSFVDKKALKRVLDIIAVRRPGYAFATYYAGHDDGNLQLGEENINFGSWKSLNYVLTLLEKMDVHTSSIVLVDGGT